MKSTRAIHLLALLVAASTPVAVAEQTNPLGKVVELIDSLSAKIAKEGEAEAKAYKEFFEWCDSAAKTKNQEIFTATAKKEQLEAAIAKLTGDIEQADAKIEELAASIARDDADLKSATTIRDKESKEFSGNEAELMDVIDTLGRAIGILEREMAKNPAAFAQVDPNNLKGLISSLTAVVDAASFSSVDKQKLIGLVQQQQGSEADEDDINAPAAAVYKTHSTNILDVLEDLKEKAEEQLSDLRKAETNTKHNYEMLKQSLEDQIAADTQDLGEQKAAKAAAEEAKANTEGELAGTVKDLEDAKAALEVANSNCMQTAADHAATVADRTEELRVLAQARQMLASSTPGAVTQTYSFLQLGDSQQTRSMMHTHTDLANAEVVAMIKRLAREQHSEALAQLASRISAVLRYGASGGQDPFVKVKGLISDLIRKLEAEADSETTEKAYCDEQLAKTEEKKSELEYDIAKLTAKIDQAVAKSAGLKADVKELQAELATLARQQSEMDQIRAESHAAFVQAKADLEQGLAGVRQALSILREYYGSAALLQGDGSMSALMQQPATPDLHSQATGAGQGIIGILEVVESDFAKNLATEETEEDDAATEYDKTTQMNQITKTLKTQDVKYKTQAFMGLDKSIADLTADLDTENAELSAVLEYYAKVKERCIAKPETYAERKRRREAEIAGLKEALSILEGETAFVQRSKKVALRGHFLGMIQ